MGKHKKFSPSLFKKNDPKTRRVVIQFFKKHRIYLEDNPNKFGVDLLSIDRTLEIEVEHRNVWINDEFPYPDINLPERKLKYFTSNNICYAIISKNYTHIGIIYGKTLKKYLTDVNLKECSNKFIKSGEYFYKIPKSEFVWSKL